MVKTKSTVSFDPITQKNVQQWLDGNYDEKTKKQLRQLIQDNPQEVTDAFYINLSFGTGGMRGVMGIGTNRFNPYTVRAATQGLANYINSQKGKDGSVVIGYDSRHHSREFAEQSAKVLAANGIKAYLFKELRPTPLVSFACRHFKCTSAIMITASHNPPEYNGFKVYWDDGAQVLPPHDKGIIEEVNKVNDISKVKTAPSLKNPLIFEIGEEVDAAYLKAIFGLQNYPLDNKQQGSRIKVVYSNLHGTGATLVPPALKQWGFTDLELVAKQLQPDGNFPTTASPNPEERAALTLGIEQLLKNNADLLIATDPDADRMGIAVSHKGEAVLLNGNQIACVCLEHICEALTSQGRMPSKAAFIKTIVTTELFKAIVEKYGKACFDVLTGFKYIAEKIREWEGKADGYQFIYGGEESYGYLLGTHCRDKDAVVSCALMCEVALQCKLKGMTLVDKLNGIYKKYGVYHEKLISVKFPETKAGKEQMKSAMDRLQKSPPTQLCGVNVVALEDYQAGTKKWLKTGKTEPIKLPKSDVLLFWLEDGTKVVIRPSGTEPKVKLYGGGVLKDFKTVEEGVQLCDKLIEKHLNALKALMEK